MAGQRDVSREQPNNSKQEKERHSAVQHVTSPLNFEYVRLPEHRIRKKSGSRNAKIVLYTKEAPEAQRGVK